MIYLSVAFIAFFEFWLAYPAAITLKIPLGVATLLIAFSSSFGAIVAIFLGAKFRDWITRKMGKEGWIARRTKKFFAKGGTIGIGLLAPWILGPVLTSLGALMLGANERQLMRWVVIGIWVWVIGLYALFTFTSLDWTILVGR